MPVVEVAVVTRRGPQLLTGDSVGGPASRRKKAAPGTVRELMLEAVVTGLLIPEAEREAQSRKELRAVQAVQA